MKKILAVILMTLSGLAFANEGDLSVQVRTVGIHFDGGNTNDNLWGAGLEYEPIDRVKIGYLYARNSMVGTPRYSNYLQAQYIFFKHNDWSVGAGASLGDNYKTATQSDVKLFGIIGICNQTFERVQLCGNYTPISTGKTVTSVSFVAKFLVN